MLFLSLSFLIFLYKSTFLSIYSSVSVWMSSCRSTGRYIGVGIPVYSNTPQVLIQTCIPSTETTPDLLYFFIFQFFFFTRSLSLSAALLAGEASS